jgi:hypothetical protein
LVRVVSPARSKVEGPDHVRGYFEFSTTCVPAGRENVHVFAPPLGVAAQLMPGVPETTCASNRGMECQVEHVWVLKTPHE